MDDAQPQIVIGFATTNTHKLRETQACFQMLNPSIKVVSLPPLKAVDETGQRFCDNAALKLQAALRQPIPDNVTHVMAEDAGVLVDALDGLYGYSPFPGVHSDRWLTPEVQQTVLGTVIKNPTYEHKNMAILALMFGKRDRRARYEACVGCWEKATGRVFSATGTVNLAVADAAKGEGGFGYDPIMIPVDFDARRTMAQLSPVEKNRISHRFNALTQLLAHLSSGLAK